MEILFNNHKVCFSSEGQGKTLVFLHGFLETHDIWKEFSSQLSSEFCVIAIDLPGHGESETLAEVHSMELMADSVHAVLHSLGIEKHTIIGHSMGGYVALAYADKYPEEIDGLCLFHSHAFPDNETAKTNRDRTIEIVENNSSVFITAFIPDLFSPVNVSKYSNEIAELVRKANATPKEGIIAALRGMKERENMTQVLAEAKFPVLLIAGKDDKRIPLSDIFAMAELPGHCELLILGNTGHMGYIEEKTKTMNRIRSFSGQQIF